MSPTERSGRDSSHLRPVPSSLEGAELAPDAPGPLPSPPRSARPSRATLLLALALLAAVTMRQNNWRIIITGFILALLALGFYFFMLTIASKSIDPAALMQTVGTVSGVAGGIGTVMIITGLIGTKAE